MFESIAMICYLSMVEAQVQEVQQPLLNPKEVALERYTGNTGGEPEDDDGEKEKQQFRLALKSYTGNTGGEPEDDDDEKEKQQLQLALKSYTGNTGGEPEDDDEERNNRFS